MGRGAANVLPPGKVKLQEFDDAVKLNPKFKSCLRRFYGLVGRGKEMQMRALFCHFIGF